MSYPLLLLLALVGAETESCFSMSNAARQAPQFYVKKHVFGDNHAQWKIVLMYESIAECETGVWLPLYAHTRCGTDLDVNRRDELVYRATATTNVRFRYDVYDGTGTPAQSFEFNSEYVVGSNKKYTFLIDQYEAAASIALNDGSTGTPQSHSLVITTCTVVEKIGTGTPSFAQIPLGCNLKAPNNISMCVINEDATYAPTPVPTVGTTPPEQSDDSNDAAVPIVAIILVLVIIIAAAAGIVLFYCFYADSKDRAKRHSGRRRVSNRASDTEIYGRLQLKPPGEGDEQSMANEPYGQLVLASHQPTAGGVSGASTIPFSRNYDDLDFRGPSVPHLYGGSPGKVGVYDEAAAER